jgi:RNA polymerase sigma-70 factor (ECF subfamily)
VDPVDDGVAEFVAVRSRLFGIAYRMLGSAAEAEDIVQDVWLRWQAYDRATVRNAGAFLTTTATRLAINVAQSARVRREGYVGSWLPEPVDTSADPTLGAETGEALELAVLVLLENLSPTERAAYILREAFEYPYRRIAEILGVSEVNARQLVSRGVKRVRASRRNVGDVDVNAQRRLLATFVAAAQSGGLAELEALLAADVISVSDGGGVVLAARVPVSGRARVALLVAKTSGRFWAGVTLTSMETNGRPSVLISRDGSSVALLSITTSPDGIEEIFWLMNPSKLAALPPVLGVR